MNVIFLLILPTLLCAILMAAHFLRSGSLVLIGVCLLCPLILLIRRWWALRAMQVILILWTVEWISTIVQVADTRMAEGRPWMRMALILGAVAALNAGAAALLQRRRVRQRYGALPLNANVA